MCCIGGSQGEGCVWGPGCWLYLFSFFYMGLYEPYHDFPSLASVYFPFHVGLQEGAGEERVVG